MSVRPRHDTDSVTKHRSLPSSVSTVLAFTPGHLQRVLAPANEDGLKKGRSLNGPTRPAESVTAPAGRKRIIRAAHGQSRATRASNRAGINVERRAIAAHVTYASTRRARAPR